MSLILCGGGRPIIEIVKHCPMPIAMVYTHEGNGQLMGLCKAKSILCTTESINDREPIKRGAYIASVYYKHIIKQHVIDSVNGGIFNAHAALLPRHRGRSAVPWAIVEGDKFSGVTYHYIDAGIDTGPIILQGVCQIDDTETQTTLFEKIDNLVVNLFTPALHLVMSRFEGIQQQGQANYNSGVPYGGEINPNWPIGKIERFIRAMQYDPYPAAMFRGRAINSFADYEKALYELSKHNHSGTFATSRRLH